MQEYNIEELIDINLLQGFQDSFSQFCGIAAVITNSEGSCITRPSGFTANCNNVSRTSTDSISKCMIFFIQGAKKSISDNKPFIKKCHEGLYSIVAPILLKEQFIGALVCGQILCTDEEYCSDFENNSSIYHKSAEEIQNIADYTYNLAKLISAAIDKNYILIKSNQLRYASFYSSAKEVPQDFGIDRIYNIHELTSSINAGIEVICKKYNITSNISILSKIPSELLGNPATIQFIIEGLVSFVAPYTTNNTINIEFSCSKGCYSRNLHMKISVFNDNNAAEKLDELKNKFEIVPTDKPEGASLITSITNNILSGSIDFGLADENTITAILTIPQLDLKVN